MRHIASILAAFVFALSGAEGSDAAVSLQPIGDFERPIYVTSPPGDPDRLLIVEREGTIAEVTPGGEARFADLGGLVLCCDSERGLLSIALASDFAASGRFYAAYTGTLAAGGEAGDVHVDSFRPDPSAPGELIRESVLSVPHAEEPNHNGGQVQLGPDGHLYVSTGDGGGKGDPFENARDTDSLLGKVLRIAPRPGEVPAYTSPPGNPFLGAAGRDEIWSLGLRNPWRFSFDAVGGALLIADVGQDSREEVNLASSPGPGLVGGAGANYGWNCREGSIAYPGAPAGCGGLGGFTEPAFDYVHQNPADGAAYGCSIIGGYVVRDPALEDLFGRYVYADFCIGQLRSLALSPAGLSGDRLEGPVVERPTSFGEDSCRRVYLTLDSGAVYRLVDGSPGACRSAAPATGAASAPASRRRSPTPRLRMRLGRKGASRARLLVWATPCADFAGARVLLNRGGEPFAAKRLTGRCVARFSVPRDGRATFRAVLRGDATLRSRRLAIGAPGASAARS